MSEPVSMDSRRWYVLALLAMTQFVVILDITIVNIALPAIKDHLEFSEKGLPWVVDAYMLTFGGFLLMGGRAADLFGRKRIFLSGLVLFGLSSLACGLANNAGELITARAFQGLGGAILSPAALSLVAVTFTRDEERNKAMGIWGAVAGAGGATGVVLGGVLTDGPGWEWVFWVNVPFTLGGALIGTRLLVEHIDSSTVRKFREFDLLGAILVTAGLSALIYGLVQIGESGSGSAKAGIALGLAVLLLVAFVMTELRTPSPLVPFGIFRSRSLTAANVVMLAFAAGVVAMNFFVTLYLQQVLGYSALEAGLSFLPMALGQIVFSTLASKMLGKIGLPRVMLIGLVASAVALGWFALMRPDGSFLVDVLGPAVLLSVGGGFSFVAIVVSAISGVQPMEQGLAGGLINMSQQVGGALGLAVLSSLAAWRTDHLAGNGPISSTDLNNGFRLGLLVAAVLIAVVAAVGPYAVRPPAAAAGGGGEAAPTEDTESAGETVTS